jgi:hypothetical protein
MLRRLPNAIREFRSRHGTRPPFCVVDESDLEDLLRALLPLHFDGIRSECRTPHYAPGTRTDFLLSRQGIAVTVKVASHDLRVPQITEQLREDAAYYEKRQSCRILIGLVYDPEGMLRETSALEKAWSSRNEDFEARCIIAGL